MGARPAGSQLQAAETQAQREGLDADQVAVHPRQARQLGVRVEAEPAVGRRQRAGNGTEQAAARQRAILQSRNVT